VEIIRFKDGECRYEVWNLPDGGWNDWADRADRFLAHSIREIAAEYAGEPIEWLEINHWPYSGRLIVFPSQEGPYGDRIERVCFELSSEYLEAAVRQVSKSVPEADQESMWVSLSRRMWMQVSECLLHGDAGRQLAIARQSHRLRVAGYDYEPGEELWWLAEDGKIRD